MPNGNATVMLTPRTNERGDFEMSSSGAGFGDAGFYRLQRIDAQRTRAWRVHSLREHFRVFVDDAGELRCDHRVRFFGMPVLHLHYRMEQRREAEPSSAAAAPGGRTSGDRAL